MKTKKCFDICKKSGVFYVYQAEYNEQWLSDGSACYPITGLPMLTEDSICKLYDINDTQRNKCCFEFFVQNELVYASSWTSYGNPREYTLFPSLQELLFNCPHKIMEELQKVKGIYHLDLPF